MSESAEDQALKEKHEKLRQAFYRHLGDAIPYDPRFPNQNQTKNCHQNYMDYFRCVKKKGEDYCAWYKNAYRQICPPEWIQRWDEQRENGTFPIKDCL